MSKQDEARRVRDAALAYVGRFGCGATIEVDGQPVTLMEAAFANVHMLLTPPSATSKLANLTDPEIVAEAAASGSPIVYRRFFLDIWFGGEKVANLRWDELEGPIDCLSFKAGPWREALVSAVAWHTPSEVAADQMIGAIEPHFTAQPGATRH
jgi:hypothetical protein